MVSIAESSNAAFRSSAQASCPLTMSCIDLMRRRIVRSSTSPCATLFVTILSFEIRRKHPIRKNLREFETCSVSLERSKPVRYLLSKSSLPMPCFELRSLSYQAQYGGNVFKVLSPGFPQVMNAVPSGNPAKAQPYSLPTRESPAHVAFAYRI